MNYTQINILKSYFDSKMTLAYVLSAMKFKDAYSLEQKL